MSKLNEGLTDFIFGKNQSTNTQKRQQNDYKEDLWAEMAANPKKSKNKKVPTNIDVVAAIDSETKTETKQNTPAQKQLVNNTSIDTAAEIVVPPSIDDMYSLSDQEMAEQRAQLEQQRKAAEQEFEEKKKEKKAKNAIKKAGKKKKAVEDKVNQEVQKAEMKGVTITPQVKQQIRQQVKESADTVQITPDDYAEVKETLEKENNTNLDGVDIPQLAENIGEALDNIPDAKDVELSEIEVKPLSKKTREGFIKVKVNIKKEGIPEIINKISSEVKKRTKGLISPRVCDLRVIGNTNKTQLRSSTLKLSINTVVYKPDFTKLKVNKGTRFMISIPDDYESTRNLLVYIQESRAKTIIEIKTSELGTESDVIDFFAKNISDYYYQGYDITLKKLQRKSVGSPLMEVVNVIVANRGYKIKTYGDKEDNHIYMVDLFSKDTDINETIGVRIEEAQNPGQYNVIAFDKRYDTWDLNQNNKTINYLMQNILNILHKVYNMDWLNMRTQEYISKWKNGTMYISSVLDVEDDDTAEKIIREETRIETELSKIKHSKLQYAAREILVVKENNPELDINIEKVLSKQVLKRLKPDAYDAESVIGSTKYCSFILSYLGYQIKAGDKRSGREYITRPQYYDKYDVKDRRDYEFREKTILRKQNAQRNYNARIYVFQLEYKLQNGNSYKYICKSFNEILENTGFLTNKPVENPKSPIV